MVIFRESAIRVAVEARQLFRRDRRGIGKTLVDLYAALARRRPDWEFVLIHQLDVPNPLPTNLPNVRTLRVDILGGDRFGLWESVRLPAAAVACRADVLHCPANTGPRFPVAKMLLTVQDLIPLELAPHAPETAAWVRKVSAACRAARGVVAPSAYTKSQLVERLGVPAGKISVVGYAPDGKVKRISDAAELARVRAAYGLSPDESFAFGFGAADPRKNTPRLIAAYAGLPPDVRSAVRLLLVGVHPTALAGFRETAERLGVAARVILHGFAEEADLPGLLSAAAALCFPSRSEGFGLPVLDAFACDLPVLAGDRTSLPEVVGDAGVLVDPDDTASITAGLNRILTDADLRAAIIARGRDRLNGFTWEKSADALAAALAAAGRSQPLP